MHSNCKQAHNNPIESSQNPRQNNNKLIEGRLADIRVVQTNLVYAIGIDSSLCYPHLLQGKCYFGKYGGVTKLVINGSNKYKNGSHAAYVTYDNEISAAMAVIGLFEKVILDKVARCCFGTSKYCETFFRGNICRREGCVFLHERNKSKEINLALNNCRESEKQIFRKQLLMAYETVYANRKDIIKKYRNIHNDSNGFPSIYEILYALVENNYMTAEELDKEWEEECELNLNKCYSESTQSSPVKYDGVQSQQHSQTQQLQQCIIRNEQKQSAPPEEQQQIVVEKYQKIVNEQKKKQSVEQIISKSIVSQLFSNKKNKSKMGYEGKPDEKIKKYVEKFMIMIS